MKTKISLNACFGIMLLGVGVLILFFVGIEIYQRFYFNGFYSESITFSWSSLKWREIFFIILGFSHLGVGIALMMKVRWSQWAANILAVITFLGWSDIVWRNFEFRRMVYPEFWAETGFTALVYGLIICGVLFLGNEKFRKELDEFEDQWGEDILDA